MNELISKLNSLGKHISESNDNSTDLESLNEILEIAKQVLFKDESNAYTAALQNNELIGAFRFRTMDVNDVNEEFNFLRLLAKVCTVYLRKNKNVYNYYVLQEIFYTLNYIAEELFIEPTYKNVSNDYSIKQREFHYQVSLYKYEFALLEKIRSLLINMFYKKDSDEKMSYQEQDKALDAALKRIAKNKVSYINLNAVFTTDIRKSNVFNYLRKLRNRMVHGYLNPEKLKNFDLDIYLLYILIFYTFSELVINLKSDDDLVDVYQQVNK